VMATGTVQPIATVDVGTQVSGVVAALAVDFNSPVHAGQVVAMLDASSYDAQLREALAARTQAESALQRADADVLGFRTAVEDAQMKLTRAEALMRRCDRRSESPATEDSGGTTRAVWEYDGKRFTPIPVRAGIADDGWTELVTGSIRPGDALVTSVVLHRRPRL